MSVNHISSNPGDGASQEAEAKAIADTILNNFELPESLVNKVNEAEKKEKEPVVEESDEEHEEVPDVAAESETEETAESEESEEVEEEADEELIPKSKMQKRLDEMTREKRLLEARLRKLEDASSSQQKPVDDETSKLEKMSEQELAALKKQVRVSQIKSQNDDAMLGKLMELEDKIDGVMRTAPQRFAQAQISKFSEAVQMSAPEIDGFEKVQKDIFGLAKRIYDTAPELHGNVNGQARAWNLAVEHFNLLRESNIGKTKINELNREKNSLKKKVSIGGVSKKASTEPDSTSKLFKKAKVGDARDKLDFIRNATGVDAVVDSFMANRT